jgi:hypothetical protein
MGSRKKERGPRTMSIKANMSFVVLAILMVGMHVPAVAQEEGVSGETKTAQLQNRIDFGNAYIMGQSITSGSVYLLNRKKSDISSMLKVRSDFREEIIEEYSLEESKIVSKETDAETTGSSENGMER